jgi:DNA-binding XRE family transcriptional regulator
MECVVKKITGAQVRAARAFLKWTIADLARHADVGDSTVRSIEADDNVPEVKAGLPTTREWRIAARDESLTKITTAFVKEGISFSHEVTKGQGVRWLNKIR